VIELSKVYFIDIDETICFYENVREYQFAKPYKDRIDKINNLYDDGNYIVYWTARGSKTGIDWFPLTEQQLNSWGVKYHELRCDKPYYDIFVDDKSIDSIDKL